MTKAEAFQAIVGQTLVEVKEPPLGGIFMVFSDGTVLWWRA